MPQRYKIFLCNREKSGSRIIEGEERKNIERLLLTNATIHSIVMQEIQIHGWNSNLQNGARKSKNGHKVQNCQYLTT